MRTQIAKGYVQTLSRRQPDALTPERLVCVALLGLYVADPISAYREHRYACDKLIRRMCDRSIEPEDTRFQQELRSLVPFGQHINLYLSTYKKPDVAVSLVRGSDNLFRIAHPRIRTFRGGEPPRDGVLAYWADTAPPPDHAIGLPMNFKRIVRGGRAISQLVEEVQSSPELQRQLANAVRLQRCLASVDLKNTLTVWSGSGLGKAVFAIEEDDQLSMKFTGLRIRTNGRPPGKFRVTVVSDVPAEQHPDIGKQPRYFGTVVKDWTYDDSLDPDTEALVEDLLALQIVPIVGVSRGPREVDVYCLHYDRENPQNPGVILCHLQTVKQRTESVPYIIPREGKLRPEPNVELLTWLKKALLEPQAEGMTCWQHRQTLLRSIFAQFISFSKEGWQGVVDLFADAGLAFTADEAEAIVSRA